LNGITVGVFGSEQDVRSAFLSSVGKKSEAEGIVVYHRTEGGRRVSFLDTLDFPDRIQGIARIASLADHALYVYPKSGKLSAPDGELAVLLTSAGLGGTLEIMDGSTIPEAAKSALRGTAVGGYPVEERSTSSSAIDLSKVGDRGGMPSKGTLIYVDRVFSVKGVGTVALGFVLCGTVSVHDQLRPIPGPEGLRLDVRGIQINDEDYDSAGRGIRVGLSLRGAEAKELERSPWLDDGSFELSASPSLEFEKSNFYRPSVEDRDLHLQLPGEMVTAKLEAGSGNLVRAKLPIPVPVWDGMKAMVLDLNGKGLRVAGGATIKV
jgi:selenocysteine-specific translation elongation factor